MLFQSILGHTPSGAGCAAPLLQQAQAVRGARPQAGARLTLRRAAAALPCPAGPPRQRQRRTWRAAAGDVVSRAPLRRAGGSWPAEQHLPGSVSRCPRFLWGWALASTGKGPAAQLCCNQVLLQARSEESERGKNKSPAEQEPCAWGKAPAWEKMLLTGTFPAPSQKGEPSRSTVSEPQTAPPQPRRCLHFAKALPSSLRAPSHKQGTNQVLCTRRR